MTTTPRADRLPWWPWTIGLLVCLAGVGVSAYLTVAHYTDPKILACPDTGTINCAKVTTSVYSHILGIPVAVLGLVFFVGIIPFHLPVAWRSQWWVIRGVRIVGSLVGVGMVVYLVSVELFKLDAICIYCTGVHALTLILFGVTLLGTVATARPADEYDDEDALVG